MKQCLLHLNLNLQVGKVFQQLGLLNFLDRSDKLNLKEKRFLIWTKKLGQEEVGTRLVPWALRPQTFLL